MTKTTFYLKDYLQPSGKFPYDLLFVRMEAALKSGNEVHVISVPGSLIALGKPGRVLRPWSDCDGGYYSNAMDCIGRRKEENINLYCGIPPKCSQCLENDAKIQVCGKPFCAECVIGIIEHHYAK